MATTTPNFGWAVPTSSDLVKNGATAIETLGDSIDASLVDLKGGTTGQVLAKATNTDMDFSWVAQDDSNAIQNALLTTTGDTIFASAASTPARRAIGTTGQVLTVSGGVPVWATPAGGGGKVLQVVHAGTSTELYLDTNSETDTGLTGTITPTSATSTILVFASISGLNNACNNDTTTYGALKLYRGATMIKQMENRSPQSAVNVTMGSSAVSYIDSPATTSATTYKVTAQRSSGTSVLRYQHNGSTYSSITLMEIGA